MVGGMYFVAGVICLPLLFGATRLRSEQLIKIEITEDSSVDVSIVSDDEDSDVLDNNVTDLLENKNIKVLDNSHKDPNGIYMNP